LKGLTHDTLGTLESPVWGGFLPGMGDLGVLGPGMGDLGVLGGSWEGPGRGSGGPGGGSGPWKRGFGSLDRDPGKWCLGCQKSAELCPGEGVF
jgi:hypothetical protein